MLFPVSYLTFNIKYNIIWLLLCVLVEEEVHLFFKAQSITMHFCWNSVVVSSKDFQFGRKISPGTLKAQDKQPAAISGFLPDIFLLIYHFY